MTATVAAAAMATVFVSFFVENISVCRLVCVYTIWFGLNR